MERAQGTVEYALRLALVTLLLGGLALLGGRLGGRLEAVEGALAGPDGGARTPTPTPLPAEVRITAVLYDGTEPRREGDEYVQITNLGGSPQDLAGWRLRDRAGHTFTFPSYLLEPGASCRVYTNRDAPEWCGFSFRSPTAIWNNDGDTAYLYDASGRLVDRYSW